MYKPIFFANVVGNEWVFNDSTTINGIKLVNLIVISHYTWLFNWFCRSGKDPSNTSFKTRSSDVIRCYRQTKQRSLVKALVQLGCVSYWVLAFFFYRYVFTFLSIVTITMFKDYDCLIFSEFSMKHLNYFFIKRHSLHSYKESVFSEDLFDNISLLFIRLFLFVCFLT